MLATLRGLVLAFGLFAGSFVLHIAGGATSQDWLFAVAVALIFVSATGFPVIALWLARQAPSAAAGPAILAAGAVIGVVLTASALWAADGRSFAAWHPFAAIALVGAVSGALLAAARTWNAARRSPERPPAKS